MRKTILLLTVLLSESQSMDRLWHWWSGETPITSPQDYSQRCLIGNEYPILNQVDHDSQGSLRGATIPPTSLVYEHDAASTPSDTVLQTSRNHYIKATIVSFRMEHSFTGISLVKKYPFAFIGGYAATFILPTMISTPIWTLGIAGGLGYTWWSNRDVLAESWNDFNKLKRLSGIQTSLGQALSRSGCHLEPTFKPGGLIQFQGHIPNGLIPGQSLYVDLVVRPTAELTL
ncbi:MAG: hypothetical protein KF820_03845 [Candidatus Paracaedibacteraceae bacterium]|nr:hypothetical protein [Candidatus Paracaedibacteraceae bacterium]